MQQLRVPGPTPLPDRVVRSASRPMMNHRGAEFADLLVDCVEGMQWAMQTANDVLLFPASGTGGLEAAAANLLSPGEPVLACTMGWFGELWADIAAAFGADVVGLRAPWGEAIDADELDATLAAHPEITKVLVTHNETSTGVTNDVRAIATVVKERGCLLALDSVSGAGCLPLPVDELGIDVVVTSSQKGWLAPPGLTMIAVSPGALAASVGATCPRWYFDFSMQKRFQDRHQTHMTPPLSVMYALQEGLKMLREEGRERVWRRHERVAEMIRAGLAALGLRLYASRTCRSDTVTAVHSPTSSSSSLSALLQHLNTRHGLVLAEGYGPLQGRIFRVGHLGLIGEDDAYDILDRIEQGLVDHGLVDEPGRAVAAARAVVDHGRVPARDALVPAGAGDRRLPFEAARTLSPLLSVNRVEVHG